MKVVLITQNEPFYLSRNINYLINKIDRKIEIPACVLFDVSPFGKKESFLKKFLKTYKIFGFYFTLYYSLKFIKSIFFNESLMKVLSKNNIKIIKLEKDINNIESINIIREFNPDLLVSILGNQIFKENIINLASKGCINLHTALLPKYRGLMPTFWVLKNGEQYTGVSVFFVDEGIDSGPIIVQKKIKINNVSQSELINITKKLGMDAIIEAINLIYDDNVDLITNNNSEMSYFTFPTRKDVIEFKRNGKKFF